MRKLLTDVCAIQYGYAFDSSCFSESEGFPLVRIRDVVRGFSETYTTEKCDAEYVVHDGDMLIGMDGEFNIAKWKGGNALLNQRVCKLMPTDSIDAGYLFYFMPSALKAIEAKTPFATVKHLSAKELAKIEIPLLPIDKQKRIAKVLDTVSTIIATRKQQLSALDDLVKARFVEMFGAYADLKEKAGTYLKDMRNGVSPSTRGTHAEKVLTLSAITQGSFDEKAWKDGLFDECPGEDKRVKADDFYMCRGNGNKALVGTGVYSEHDRLDLVFPDTVIAARVDTSRLAIPYLFYAWKQPEIRQQIESGARTTNGTYKINQKILLAVEIVVPPLELQKRFSAFVAQADKSKLTIQRSLDKLEMLKKALMQEYFG